jgi:DNA repair exonuclease SbcCD ATPase subunit
LNRLRQNPAIDTNEIEKELVRLEKELQRVVYLARKSDAALAALEEQRDEYMGRLQLARRAEEDVKRRIDEKRDELQRAEDEAVIENYERAVGERESAAERFASTASAAVAALREYKAAQESVAHAVKAVRSRPGAGRSVKSEAEPAIVAESVELLVDIVRKRLDTDLERDLVEAAARSPMGYDIKNLPTHLQALARERRLAILNEAAGRDRGAEDEPRS